MNNIFTKAKHMFSTKHVHKNDRYAIYKMVNRMVTFQMPLEGIIEGYVEEVYRDVFEGDLRVKINGKVFRFKEPDLIRYKNDVLIFIYGDIDKKDVTDEQLFEEMKKEQFRESVEATVNRLDPKIIRELRFKLGEKRASRKRFFCKKK